MRRFVSFFIIFALHLPLYAQSLSEKHIDEILAEIYNDMEAEHFQEALEKLFPVLENTKQQQTVFERQTYVYCQIKLAECYYHLNENEKGYKLCEQLLKEQLPEVFIAKAQKYLVLNGCSWAMDMILDNKYEESRKLSNSILPLAEGEVKQIILRTIPKSWYFEGLQHQLHQSYQEALLCMEKARNGFSEQHDLENECETVCQIGDIKKNLGDYSESLEMYQLSRDMAEKFEDGEILFLILRKQYNTFQELGDAEMSFYLASQMDSLVKVTTSEEVKYEYNYFKGGELEKQKKYRLVEQWYLKNLPYKVFHEHENYIWGNEKNDSLYANKGKYVLSSRKKRFYQTMYSLYNNEGNYQKALNYAQEKLKIDKTRNEVNALSYLDIAYAYQKMRDSVNCFLTFDSIFCFIDKLNEPKEIAFLYKQRGYAYLDFSMYKNALKDYEMANEILATKYNEHDEDRTDLLCSVGALYYKLRNYEKAIDYQKAYAEGMKALYGEGSPSYLTALTYLAKAKGYGGHTQEGCQIFSKAAKLIRDRVRSQLPFYTSSERGQLWTEFLNGMTPFAIDTKETQTEFTEVCYDNLIQTKSFLLQTERSSFDVIKRNGTESDLKEFIIISNLNRIIKDIERDSLKLDADSVISLISRLDSLERDLSVKCRSFGDITSFMDIGYKDIKGALNENEVLIDYTDFYPESGGRVYAAYFVEKKQNYPLLKKLFAESTIDSLGFNSLAKYYNSSKGQEMTKLIWDPLKNHVKEGTTVYYVPSQILFQIVLESLPLEDGTLLGDHYNFVRLSSSREVLNVRSHFSLDMAPQDEAVLYGGLEYNVSVDTMVQESKKYDVSHLMTTRGEEVRGDSIFSPLPYTKEEIDKIGGILQSYDVSVRPYSGAKGTEESFVSMDGKSPKILHVATHGFYYTSDKANETNYLRGYTDAMLLSGIVLAGGNAAWQGKELPEKVMEGILTAYDIASLDLSNTDLVVLSACQTGRGEATAEGLFGLQRAFKKAGAKTIVMSLWDVDDKVTKEFMVKFYENLTANGWNKQKAFNETKNFFRDNSDYSDPYYWAGFVMLD